MPHDIRLLFNPRSIAVVGASDRPGSIGRRVVENLVEHSRFTGALYLVNPGRERLFGRECHPDVAGLPEAVDVAVVVVPAPGVLVVLRECARRGVAFAMVLTSGFGEADEEGSRRQGEMAALAADSGMRIVGPNCPGCTNLHDRIGMTFSPAFPEDSLSGPIGLATQGGGLGRTVLQAGRRGVGTALWASVGNAADLDVPEVITAFAADDRVAVIATLLEGISDGQAFLRAVRAAADAGKPVVALKVGRSAYGARAVASHTAALAGAAAVNHAVFEQFGVVEVDDIDELIDVAWLLARARPPATTRLAVWGTSGGALSLCADLIGQAGLRLAELSPGTRDALAVVLPSYAATDNPVDVTATALGDPGLARDSLRAVAADPGVDLVLIPDPLDYGAVSVPITEAVARVQSEVDTPLLPVWMSDRKGPGFDILARAGFGAVSGAGKAVTAVARWAAHGAWTAARRPGPVPLALRTDLVPKELPCLRTEPAVKSWLAHHGIAVPRGITVTSDTQTVAARAELGAPLVAKVVSPAIAHKTEAGGVRTGLTGEAEVLAARAEILAAVGGNPPVLLEEMVTGVALELLVGVHLDPVFGHVLTVGSGGLLVDLLADTRMRLLPLDRDGALALIDELRVRPLLDGVRGGPALDPGGLADLLTTISGLITEHPQIVELDLNPVALRPGRPPVVLDALVVT